MSDSETKTDQDNAARMQKMRDEFLMAWPEIYEKISQIYNRPDYASCHHCAWMAWRAAKATSPASDGSEMRLKIAELEAARSEALVLLESLLPITWSEDWDADEVRRKLEWAIRFCGGTARTTMTNESTKPTEQPNPPLPAAHGSAISVKQLNKMDLCRHLLPDPGSEVAGQLISEIRRLRAGLERLMDGDFVGTPINRGCGAMELIEETLSPNAPGERPGATTKKETNAN